jgi:hypothetical protein
MTYVSRAILFLVLLTPAAGAQESGPDTCVTGFVWREAFSDDHVCVDPAVRSQAATDNQLAPRRRMPGGGAYGPDTCRQGFVWRETRPEDHVCVTPQTRTQASNDNGAAASRVVRAQATPARGARLGAAIAARDRVSAVNRAVAAAANPVRGHGAPPPRPQSGSPSTRGFDEMGNPYIEEVLPDGSRRREQANGVTVIKPDGTSEYFPYSQKKSNVQPPTPPELPQDPARGLNWVNYHNKELLDLIARLVNNDAAQMDQFRRAEDQSAGSDPFKQIRYRMRVLDFLAKP